MVLDNDNKVIAEHLCKHNFSILPVFSVRDGKCGCNKTCDKQGKHPATMHGVKDATKDVTEITSWLNDGYNIALATGETSGVFVLDVDDEQSLTALEAKHGKLPQTWTVLTGSGGKHIYFKFDDRCKMLKNSVKFCGNLDIRTTNGYVLLPPSKHLSGNTYSWVTKPEDVELASAPDWLIELLPKHEAKPIKIERAKTTAERCVKYLANTPPAISGSKGHDHTFGVVCKIVELFGHELDDEELLECLNDWNERCEPAWTLKELSHKLDSARNRVSVAAPSGLTGARNGGHDTSRSDVSAPATEAASADDDIGEITIEFPTLHEDAFQGVVGQIVKAIEPETEADQAGVLLSILTACGSVIGKTPHCTTGADEHGTNLFVALVGDTASGKGQAWNIAKWLMKQIDSAWFYGNCSYGLASGEGLIERVADAIDADAFSVPEQKRLLCVETEFARPIAAMRREGSVLSPSLRSAWDGSTLEVMTRGKTKVKASNAHVSIIAHITPNELKKLFGNSIETSNGFANRFLWCLVESTKSLPHGGDMSVVQPFVQRLASAIERAKGISAVGASDDYKRLWESVYSSLKDCKSGATDRARPQVLRLSLLYALLDESPNREDRHLRAALAVWRYCEESARILFTTDAELREESKHERRIVVLVKASPGIMRTDLRNGVSHHLKAAEFDTMLNRLVETNRIVKVPVLENNRQAERYYPAAADGMGIRALGSDDHASATTKADPTALLPLMPLIPTAQTQTRAATLVELCEWRAMNAVHFAWSDTHSIYWVTKQDESKLTPAIEQAIREQQSFVQIVSGGSSVPTLATSGCLVIGGDDGIEVEDEDFLQELTDMKPSIINAGNMDADTFLEELEAFNRMAI